MEQYREFRAFQKAQRRKEAVENLRQLRAEISEQFKDLSPQQIEELAQELRDEVMQAVVEKYGHYAVNE